MNEYLLLIHKNTASKNRLTQEKQLEFLHACERYIGQLKSQNQLIDAKPIQWEGNIIEHSNATWIEHDFTTNDIVIGGFYHIRAANLNEAKSIAQLNPEFVYHPDTRIEVRPLKTIEPETAYHYTRELH